MVVSNTTAYTCDRYYHLVGDRASLDSPSIKTPASMFGLLLTFVNIFSFYWVVMFVCFVNKSSIVSLIYSKQLVLLYCKRLEKVWNMISNRWQHGSRIRFLKFYAVKIWICAKNSTTTKAREKKSAHFWNPWKLGTKLMSSY